MNFMKKLKGFSLAEILIVMTVIGVIATLTMPQLIGGVDEAHYKAGYKKAYSTVANVAGLLKSDDELPTAADQTAELHVFKGLCDNVEVEGMAAKAHTITAGAKLGPASIVPGATYDSVKCGDTSATGALANIAYVAADWSPWIIAADGMAFTVNKGGGCGTKGAINTPTATAANAYSNACVVVLVDVNGLERLPNKIEPQSAGIGSTTKMSKLTGDRFYIYIAKDGIAKGSELTTVTGRLISGAK